MVFSKPYNDAEKEYIRAHYAQMGCAAVAAKLGRSERGVRNAAKEFGLTASCAPGRAPVEDARAGEAPVDEETQDELAELREIKRVLKRTLRGDVSPKDMPKLSAELREVIKRISDLEGGADGGGGAVDSESSIVVSVPLRPA